jgi:hypothetical protein
MRRTRTVRSAALLAVLTLTVVACGDDDEGAPVTAAPSDATTAPAGTEAPSGT